MASTSKKEDFKTPKTVSVANPGHKKGGRKVKPIAQGVSFYGVTGGNTREEEEEMQVEVIPAGVMKDVSTEADFKNKVKNKLSRVGRRQILNI